MPKYFFIIWQKPIFKKNQNYQNKSKGVFATPILKPKNL
jgi:hypothetical protein